MFLPSNAFDGIPWLGMQFITSYYNPRYLVGRGAPGFPRRKFLRTRPLGLNTCTL